MGTSVEIEPSRTVDIGGGMVPGVVLTGVLRSSVFRLPKGKSFIGLCNLLGKGGVVEIDDWLMEGPRALARDPNWDERR